MKIAEKLKTLGVEVTPEIEKAFPGEFLSEEEVTKKLSKVEKERDTYKTNYETAKSTLDGFEGKDFDQITKDRDTWKQKAETAEKEHKKQLEQRDYADLLGKATEGIKFSSNAAKKAFLADLTEKPLQMREGSLLGFDDFLKQYKTADASAFVDETEEQNKGNAAKFTDTMNGGAPQTQVTGDPSKMNFADYKKWRAQNQ